MSLSVRPRGLMGSHSLACCNACLRGPRIRGEFLNVPFIRNLGVFGRIPSAARGLKRDRRLVAPGFSGKSNLKSRIYSESSTALASSNSFCHGNNLLYRAGSIGFSTRQVHCNATLNTPPVQLEQTKGEHVDQATETNKIRQYPFPEIESKWQRIWDEEQTFRTPDAVDTSKPKYYVLDMFPYPSGAGLHVGHPEGYTATDIMARYKRMKGFNVLHPMGWDAFGLPAEQYAIQTGTHPRETTLKNIDRFRSQLKSLGFSYDWQRELSTTEPDYYKWTQWIFLQLFNKGLAFQAEVPVNWCPELGTVLANEEVIDGLSERGGFPVIRKPMKQWMLKITAYADRLLEDLDDLDWPENIKDMQRNWIGRSEGAEVDFEILNSAGETISSSLRVFTTRPDTLCGATYLVVAPEHPLLKQIVSADQKDSVEKYVDAATRKSDLERTELQKEKTGVFTGAMATNPANGESIPVWVADYVLGSYGTGAIMAVPAHDTRDYEFAVRFDLPIRVVVSSGEEDALVDKRAYAGEGTIVNSSLVSSGVELNGLPNNEAAEKITQWLEESGKGKRQVNYKLRDWLFARQRYWGEPFPIIFFENSNEARGVAEVDLPVTLPEIDDFTPTGTGEPPLAKADAWVTYTDEESGKVVRRETNTMPQWAGSCWYYLRFMDPKNSKAPVDPEKERYWGPVDLYVGGSEHSVLHLLYARFWHKVLYDIGVVSTKEPFKRLVNQGMILGEVEYTTYRDTDGNYVSADSLGQDCLPERVSEKDVLKSGDGYVLKYDQSIRVSARAHKMSKSRGNVINPDDVVTDFGADSLRLYEMFMGPLRDTKVWSTNGVEGVYRFLGRAWRFLVGIPPAEGPYPEGSLVTDGEPSLEQLKILHRCIYRVTDDIEGMRFNTAIAGMMEFLNAASKWRDRPRAIVEPFVLLLSPFAPHIAEELWCRLGHSKSLAYESWPEAKDEYLKEDVHVLPVQMNGKLRGTIEVPAGADEETAFAAAIKSGNFDKFLEGKEIKKKIYVPGRILNLIIK
ncbi:leucyl-tRNA synthetase [Marchantia polymorpha subsp. ruderalis]|uniref:leucine--tRNA ligase n=2 Tax=Marchantia polymorpha TaxID=3197 RepID=A0AAF6B3N6_MARPO|nr:hypothetical protein MARPO_0024s0038 [Marchantia polymorpha]BBN06620.1 hypothetical protein Mp_3g22600 [Marchantia polymorpha subsp. ruderalis]|eukprot:PTQ43520.1 hypothetical protein MARPO_0024s0038 [Marchantia polymorpha]